MHYKQLAVVILFVHLSLAASVRLNLLQPYDTLIRPQRSDYRMFDINFFTEVGVRKAQGFNSNDEDDPLCPPCNLVNVLQIWNKDQNSLKMLEGFDPLSPIGQKQIQINANDDGIRGHFCLTGDLKLKETYATSLYWHFWDYLYLAIYLPYYKVQLTNICLKDLTNNITEDDIRVKEYLTNAFAQNVCTLGNLRLSGWNRSGVGDLSILIEFSRSFPQIRPLLKNVRTNIRTGLIIPTGKKENEDLIFAIPFGYDGAVGLLTGGGLDISLGYHIRGGFDVQIINLFGNTKERRIKTTIDQTELFLLQKVTAYKDWGLVQRFNIYTELYDIYKGLSLLIGYQFLKQGDSTLSFCSCDFSTYIANTAQSLQESTIHQAIVKFSYDFSSYMSDCAWTWPYISLYTRVPFNGENTAQLPVIGLVVSLDF